MSKTIGVIVGSLRDGSFSRIVAEKIVSLLPQDFQAKFIEIGQLPFYNEDIDTPENTDPEFTAFRAELKDLDGYLFVTPEYNRSVPAVLKNALDVGSRPYGHNNFSGKPALVVSVSPGAIAGFGANHHLRQTLTFLNMPVVQQPEAYIGSVHQLIDENGEITKPETVSFLQTLADALVDLVHVAEYRQSVVIQRAAHKTASN